MRGKTTIIYKYEVKQIITNDYKGRFFNVKFICSVQASKVKHAYHAYQMLLSFKASVTYIKKILTLRLISVSVVKQLSSNITQVFARHCPMSGANIQA